MSANERKLHGSGLAGTLKLFAALAVVALAILASLVVLGVIPRETFADAGIKLVSLAAIAGLTSVVLWALLKIGQRG